MMMTGEQIENHTISEDLTAGLAANQERNVRSVFGQELDAVWQSANIDLSVLESLNRDRYRMQRKILQEEDAIISRSASPIQEEEQQKAHAVTAEKTKSKRRAQHPPKIRASKRRINGRSQTDHKEPEANGSRTVSSSGTSPLPKVEEVKASSTVVTNQVPLPTSSHEETRPGYGIIYRVKCHDRSTRDSYHKSQYFLDRPTHVSQLNTIVGDVVRLASHLNGLNSIPDLEEFVLQNYNNWHFIEIRELSCADAAKIQSIFDRGRWTKSTLLVSDLLLSKILSIATYAPVMPAAFEPQEPLQNRWITRENMFFYHHREKLEEIANNESEEAHQVRTLLEYVDGKYGLDFAEAGTLLKQGIVTPKHLWKLFPPNSVIIGRRFDRPIAAVLDDNFVFPSTNKEAFSCWIWAPGPSGFVRRRLKDQFISDLSWSSIRIQDLPIMPLRYTDSQLIKELCARGRKYWDYQGACHISYTGWNTTGDSFYPDARFIIDYKMYRTMHTQNSDSVSDTNSRNSTFDRRPEILDRRHDTVIRDDPSLLMHLPCDVQGFYLIEKKWISIFIDGITSPRWNKQAFDRLVLPAKKKNIVKALITVRTSQRGIRQGLGPAGKREDLISGKGNGLIMLLHGSPGTGKSLTAESVAEIAEMPLYRVTCGDIGTDASSVEKYLNTVFNLGKAWNCVLLLDEADVFLEERSMSDLERNSLVSVFLRSLEYYDGILILTSNRVGTFDEAIRSRIQVALHYETLTTTSRRKIWQNFFDMLEEDGENASLDELRERLGELADHEMNGRQIRNTLTTARQLAIYEKETLAWEHLEQALSVSIEFTSYLKKVQGSSSDDWARDVKIR